VTRDVLLGRRAETPAPDVILCVVDATNLERNLYLVAQLAELGIPAGRGAGHGRSGRARWLGFLVAELERRLGCPVVPTVAAEGKGLVELRQAITRQLNGTPPQRATFPPRSSMERGAGEAEFESQAAEHPDAPWRSRSCS
jgi:ferrous iron transport protein B